MKKLFTSFILICILISCSNIIMNTECHQGSGHNNPQQHQQQLHQQQQQQQHHDPNANPMHINKEHVLEHLDGVINKPKDQMTVDEQNFYYFKLHDYDNNNVLDGLELVTAFAHNLNEEHSHDANNASGSATDTKQAPPIPRIADDELMRLIDGIMKDEDKNSDGYITYQEFLKAVKGN